MDHISQDGVSRMINQLDDSTKQIIASVAGFGMLGVAVYVSLSPEQKEKIVNCFRALKECTSHVLTQIGETAGLAAGRGGIVEFTLNNQRNVYNNHYYNRNNDIDLQLGLESTSPRLQNALENSRNNGGYQR